MKLLYAEDEESMAEAVTDILVFRRITRLIRYMMEKRHWNMQEKRNNLDAYYALGGQQSVKQQNELPVQPDGNTRQ